MTLLLNRELVSRAKLCLVTVFPDIVKDCPKIRNYSEIFLRSFENVDTESEWSCEMENQTTTAFGYCPNTAFLSVHCSATLSECHMKQKTLTASPLENWRRPPGRTCTKWMKTIQQMKSNGLSLNEASDMA